MATITPATASTSSPPTIAPVASAPAGDEITVAANQGLFIVVDNGHTAPITVTIPGQPSTISVNGKGEGTFTPASISASVTNGTSKVFHVSREMMSGYRNSATGRVSVNYTSGAAALTLQAVVA